MRRPDRAACRLVLEVNDRSLLYFHAVVIELFDLRFFNLSEIVAQVGGAQSGGNLP